MVSSLPVEAELLYLALAEPIGLLIQCDDFEALRTRLYKVKHTLADPALAILQFRQSPIEGGNLIITKYQVMPKGRPPMRAESLDVIPELDE